MSMVKLEVYLQEVVSYVKFPYDKEAIKEELRAHMEDCLEDLVSAGYSQSEAAQVVLENMGDAKVIGEELNQIHHPLIGWLWMISKVVVKISIFLFVVVIGLPIGATLFSRNPIKDIPKETIVYHEKINERVRMDDRIIWVTDVLYDTEGTLHIIYNYMEVGVNGWGWSFSGIGEIYDEEGVSYWGSNGSDGGFITRAHCCVRDFPKEAEVVIIDYDYYNRQYHIEIPLEIGDQNE